MLDATCDTSLTSENGSESINNAIDKAISLRVASLGTGCNTSRKVIFHDNFCQVYTSDPAAAEGRMEAIVEVL